MRLRTRNPVLRLAALVKPAPLPGVEVQGYVGELHGTPLPAATSAASAAAATVATAPDGAVLQLRITDGSSVAEKVAQLLAHPGGQGGRKGLSWCY